MPEFSVRTSPCSLTPCGLGFLSACLVSAFASFSFSYLPATASLIAVAKSFAFSNLIGGMSLSIFTSYIDLLGDLISLISQFLTPDCSIAASILAFTIPACTLPPSIYSMIPFMIFNFGKNSNCSFPAVATSWPSVATSKAVKDATSVKNALPFVKTTLPPFIKFCINLSPAIVVVWTAPFEVFTPPSNIFAVTPILPNCFDTVCARGPPT